MRLDKSGLIVIDCDTVPEQVVESNRATWRVVNGYEEFWSWLAGYQLCATLITSSPGRADGSHMPGWHLWFRQNENWKVIKPVKVAAHVDIKVSGIVRYTDQSHIGTDAPIATLPLELAKAFQPEESLSLLSQRSSRLGEYAKEGVNNALTALKGLLCNSWWTEEQANEVARYANQLLDDPMDAGRLERTVLREKGW